VFNKKLVDTLPFLIEFLISSPVLSNPLERRLKTTLVLPSCFKDETDAMPRLSAA